MSTEKEKQKHIDYRFSLANERTFLAWIRTSLAFLAGAVAIDQFVITHAFPFMRVLLAVFLAISSAFLAINALFRWRNNEKAMCNDEPLPYNRWLFVISLLVFIISCCFVVLFILSNE